MTENIRELAAQANEIEALRMEVAEWKGIAVAQSAEIERLRAEVPELRAARIAYASEFPEAKDGGPDTENIHANIRLLKARAERLAEALRLIESAKDRGFGIDYARGVAQSVLLYDKEKGHE